MGGWARAANAPQLWSSLPEHLSAQQTVDFYIYINTNVCSIHVYSLDIIINIKCPINKMNHYYYLLLLLTAEKETKWAQTLLTASSVESLLRVCVHLEAHNVKDINTEETYCQPADTICQTMPTWTL